MGAKTLDAVVGVMTAIIGLAILATILSQRANTVGVIKAVSDGFTGALNAAEGPVSGGGGYGGVDLSKINH